MLHTLDYENELLNKIFSLISKPRRKTLERFVKDSVDKKWIFFPGGTRFTPNFFQHPSPLLDRVIDQLHQKPRFRNGFADLMAHGLERELAHFSEAIGNREERASLIFESLADNCRSLPALVAALLLSDQMTNAAAHQICEAIRMTESGTADLSRADAVIPEHEPVHDIARQLMTEADKKPAAPAEGEEKKASEEAPAPIPAPAPLPAEKPEERPVPPEAPAPQKAPATLESAEDALPQAAAEPAKTPRKIQVGPVKRFFDVEKKPGTPVPEPALDLRRYLVYLRRAGNFTNLHVAAELYDGRWSSNPEEYKALFPQFGAFNLHSTSRITLPEGAFFVVDIDPHGLEPNYDTVTRERRSDYCDRIDFATLKREDRFFDAAAFGLYPVVYLDERLGGEPDFERNVFVRFTPPGEPVESSFRLKNVPVLLASGNYLYGPATVKEDAQGRSYVNFLFGTARGVISGFRRKESALHVVTQFCKTDNTTMSPESLFHPVHLVETEGLTPVICDVMSDDSLMGKLVSAATSDKSSRDTMAEWLAANRSTQDLFTSDERVRESRFNRIAKILDSADVDATFIDDIARLVSDTLDRTGTQGELYTKVVQRISETPELMKRLDSHRVIAAKLRELTERRDALETEIRTKTVQSKKAAENFDREVRNKNRTLIDENTRLTKVLAEKREKIDFLDTSADLITLRSSLTEEIHSLEAQKGNLSAQLDNLGEQLQNVAQSASKYAFDGAVASKLLEAAAAYTNASARKSCLDRVEAVRTLPISGHSKTQLADYLVKSVQLYREYDRNAVLNLFICLTQNFLTVFSGGPGSGKTSICSIMAKVLGLTSISEAVPEGVWKEKSDANRYLPISVERGWTSKRDFVGYFNPLTKAFESVDDRRYEAFRELDLEERRGVAKLPFVMMLDEANLSPMEYYWADFMNICDSRSDIAYISLGDKAHYHVPDTLRFLATINNDHTTEILSPRLIDRATVITLPDVDWGALSHRKPVSGFEPKLIAWDALQELFGPRELSSHKSEISDLLDELYDRFAHAGFPVSARSRLAIERYVSAASAVFCDSPQPAYAMAVDYALAQKLLPKLTGTGEDFQIWLDGLKTYCESNGLDISLKLIDGMIKRGKANMGYYKFF